MSALHDRITSSLQSRADRGILRSLTPSSSALPSPTPAPIPPLVDFSSNDYLSLSKSDQLKRKLLSSLQQGRVYGPPSSRLLDGNSELHLALEDQLSNFLRGPSALLFNSGFDANVGLWSCLPTGSDFILYDELIHASTHDGMRNSRVPPKNRRSFKHNDLANLREIVKELAKDRAVKDGTKSIWIAVETLYSMDGDLAPLKEMVMAVEEALPKGNGHFVVDEAHSTGLYGPQGRGVVCALGLANRITIRVHTFGKALACSGGVVLCAPTIRSYLINYARPLIYSTVMPHLNVLAISKAFEMLEQGHCDAAAAHLHDLSSHLLTSLSSFVTSTSSPISLPSTLPLAVSLSDGSPQASPLALPPLLQTTSLTPLTPLLSTTPIIPLLTPSPRELSKYLIEKGYLVRPICYPTVPRGEERVRVCLHAGNTKKEVGGLVEGIRHWVEEEKKKERKSKAKL